MLSENLKQEIQQAYSRFLESNQWQPRLGQKQMIAAIARTLGNVDANSEGVRINDDGSHICVVEAGTGTGKTIAYCLAAIPVAKALKKNLIISTATVALQEQIVLKDLPSVSRHAGLEFSFALAKGRSRYLCPAKLDTQLEGAALDLTLALYPDEIPAQNDVATETLFQNMLNQLASGSWDGDRDAWPQEIDTQQWIKVTTDHNQCAGRRCAYITQCPFFKARDEIQGVDVVVANHDLVLADLSLGGGAILPEPSDSIYVFDEGHHLADKAISHFACHSRVAGAGQWAKQAGKTLSSLSKALAGREEIAGQAVKITEQFDLLEQALNNIYSLVEASIEFLEAEGGGSSQYRRSVRYRFAGGVVPADIKQQAEQLMMITMRLAGLLADLVQKLKDLLDDDSASPLHHEIELWYPACGLMQVRAEAAYALWRSYAKADSDQQIPTARWISLIQNNARDNDPAGMNDGMRDSIRDFEFCSSPIQAASTLQDSLWGKVFAAVLTSATLTALNSFERLQQRTGTPAAACYESIISPFQFDQAVLSVPRLEAEPSNNDSHSEEIVRFIEQQMDLQQGNLLLFSSRRQMEDVYYALPRAIQKQILLQGELSKQEMVREHRQRIDAGEGSLLFGLASFAEGVDLPGKYCEHVLIAKIPFAVPDDPVEEALAEWVEQRGGNAFMDISVPDASIKLIQACGRLLRSEQDKGRITIMDKRLISKRYGKMLLDALPPFRRDLGY